MTKLFYWGITKKGYRQESLLHVINELQQFVVIFCRKQPQYSNKIIKFIRENINQILDLPTLIRSDLVYIPPMEHSICKTILCRVFRKKVICDIYAPIYDMTVNDEKIYSKKSLMGRLYYLRDKMAMKYSSRVLFLSEAECNYFLQTVGLTKEKVKVEVVPLVIPAGEAAKLRYYKGEKATLEMCWTGSFISLQGLEKILAAAEILSKKELPLKIHIIGPRGMAREKYMTYVERKNLTGIVDFPDLWGDVSKWKQYIAEKCDVTLGIFGDSQKARSVLANKVVDGIASRTPVLTAESSGIDCFDLKQDIFTVKNEPIMIAQQMETMCALSYETVRVRVEHAYSIYAQQFTYTVFRENIRRIIGDL